MSKLKQSEFFNDETIVIGDSQASERVDTPSGRRIVILTPFNFVPKMGVINNLPSLTIPDQSLSLSEILRRFATGQNIPAMRVDYHGEDEMPNLATLDLSEVDDYRISTGEKIQDIEMRMDNEIKANRSKRKKKEGSVEEGGGEAAG